MKKHSLMWFFILVVTLTLLANCAPSVQHKTSSSGNSPVTESHISQINSLFQQNNISGGIVDLDQYGRIVLKGEYADGIEVEKAFSLAQTVVGIKWVSPVTPEQIKVKRWEQEVSNIFKRAAVIKPAIREGEAPGPVQNRYALVVGVGKFQHGISPLQYARKDAQAFYYFLVNPQGGGFSQSNVTLLLDEKATSNSIENAMKQIQNMANEDDLVCIYMSSHGTPPQPFGGVHIATYDSITEPRSQIWRSSVTEDMLKNFIQTVRAKRLVVILDACYSNGAYKNIPGFLPSGGKSLGIGDDEEEAYGISADYGKRLLGAKDIVVEEPAGYESQKTGWGKVLISASSETEKSWESDTLQQGIFTYYIIEGLQHHNGAVEDAFYYSKPRIMERVKQEKDSTQTPNVIPSVSNWNISMSAH